MPLSRITSGSIEDGTIATADLADNAVNSAKISADVIVAEDIAANAITTAEITNQAVTAAKLGTDVSLGAGYYIGKDGTVSGNANGRDNLFRVNTNATTGNVTIAANNNASVTGPLTIGNGTTLTITSTGRLAII